MKLSIIIPMYNCEKYIADCMDSILNSDLPKGEYEVIIVNDGSKDKGPEIAQEYVAQHDNFRYLTQENQGQSVARNYGIREAKGEYIWCVDGDDMVEKKLYSILQMALSNGVDSLVSVMNVYDESGNMKCMPKYFGIPYDVIITGRDVHFSDVPIGSVCSNFLKRSFLLEYQLFFKPGIAQQDVELSNRIFAYAKRVMFVKAPSYVYIKHAESTSMSQNPIKRKKYILNTIDVIFSLQSLSRSIADADSELADKIFEKSQNQVLGLLIVLLRNRNKWKGAGIKDDLIRELKAQKLYPIRFKFDSIKKRLVSRLLNVELLFNI